MSLQFCRPFLYILMSTEQTPVFFAIERLFNRILSASYNAPLEYNSGIGNTSTLPRYQKKNLGGMPQYYAQNTHPAIIDSEA